MSCCTPRQRDEDRTHSIRYSHAYYDGDPGDPPVFEETGTLEISCSHNDAITDAAATASWLQARLGISFFAVGTNGKWRTRDYENGEGVKAKVWISRGWGEESYDEARAS